MNINRVKGYIPIIDNTENTNQGQQCNKSERVKIGHYPTSRQATCSQVIKKCDWKYNTNLLKFSVRKSKSKIIDVF